ncbi:hypothetical protein [Paraburkholderia rhizosphaerae]|uniref:Uncharacterized protein n=1 Tax=Paraburkholderia rhizosphaerae TaxID=480658 RepID=A0A4R8L6H6_9BURK|nr:hypothetical protein [Paraburkholderia rhizosphaerae]TDY38221.1 hypothetical protein BX592_13322 [Paraburkholderia rhizosphaerae]
MHSTVAQANRTLPLYWHFTPTALALGYPWYLARFYEEAGNHHTLGALFAIALVWVVPASAFVSLLSLARLDVIDAKAVILRRLAHFTFASPPLFVIIGVLLYLMKINGADGKVWLALWATVVVGTVLTLTTERSDPTRSRSNRNMGPVRVLHGAASVAIIAVFLFPHLGNHAVGIFGTDVHKTLMLALRHVYRAGWIEPIVITLFFFQIVSGLVLLMPKLGLKQRVLETLQTASGAYLVIFIASHINSVFILARYFGTDTDYAWATGAPAGLIGDAWNVRLIPHYSLGVWLVLCHIACGLRTVMLAHGVNAQRADRICWLLIAASSIWAAIVVAGMLGVRI